MGAPTGAADAEICAMLSDTLEAVGIPRGDYVVRVNNRKVLNGVLEAMGVAEEGQQAAVLRTIDKFDKVGEAGVRALLGKGRLDASGAYIDGVGLGDEQAEPVIAFLTSKGADAQETLANLRSAIGDSAIGAEGVAELEQIAGLLAAQGYGPDRIEIDPSVVRGLGYYTGPVFEAELTLNSLTKKVARGSSARWPGAGVTTISSSASRGRRYRRPACRSGWTGCWRRCAKRGG